jgi:hypothetical protein
MPGVVPGDHDTRRVAVAAISVVSVWLRPVAVVAIGLATAVAGSALIATLAVSALVITALVVTALAVTALVVASRPWAVVLDLRRH